MRRHSSHRDRAYPRVFSLNRTDDFPPLLVYIIIAAVFVPERGAAAGAEEWPKAQDDVRRCPAATDHSDPASYGWRANNPGQD